MAVLPNFLIIGAAKSGTTSLAEYLRQHPRVFISAYKEPNYFAMAGMQLPDGGPASPRVLYSLLHTHTITDYEKYLELFRPSEKYPARGEASVRYLYYEQAPIRIQQTIPDARLIAILREPVARLYSHYCMNRQFQLEPLSLEEAIAAEPKRRKQGWGWDWHYVSLGLYATQLRRYIDRFPREQLKVFFYDEFVAQSQAVFQEICRHIGVEDSFIPDMSSRGKVGRLPQNLLLDRWLHWPNPARETLERVLPRRLTGGIKRRLGEWNSSPPPKLDPRLRKDLSRLFRDEVEQLEELLGRKTPWYQ
jgi:hypothetical protein